MFIKIYFPLQLSIICWPFTENKKPNNHKKAGLFSDLLKQACVLYIINRQKRNITRQESRLELPNYIRYVHYILHRIAGEETRTPKPKHTNLNRACIPIPSPQHIIIFVIPTEVKGSFIVTIYLKIKDFSTSLHYGRNDKLFYKIYN